MARTKKSCVANDELLTAGMDKLQQDVQDAGAVLRNKSDTTRLNAAKNKSNLYIIKSYSFIDKSHAQRSLQQKVANMEAVSLQRKSNIAQAETEAEKVGKKPSKKQKPDKKSKKKEQSSTDASGKHKMQKSKSVSDSCENLRELLRKPSAILEHVESESGAAKRPQSMPMPTITSHSNRADSAAPTKTTAFKRESFLRQSLQSLRRSFGAHKKYAGIGQSISSAFGTSTTSTTSMSSGSSAASSSASSNRAKTATAHNDKHSRSSKRRRSQESGADNADTPATDIGSGGRVDSAATLTGDALEASVRGWGAPCGESFHPTESVSTLAATPIDTSMAPLQSHIEAHSVTTLNLCDRDSQAVDKQQHQQQHSANGSNHSGNYSATNSTKNSGSSPNWTGAGSNTDEARSLKYSSSSLNPLAPGVSLPSIRSISPSSRKSASSSNSSNTAKHEHSTAAATAAAAASTEKEKKRKEVSSSRVKKFHRHFTQLPKDEKLINYYSCALVSDILLQGHLYITDQHFAFYSNVFGYVTKVVIPTSSVTKISKEKTAKIIPNAVGVATVDERHVFGSFISREAAFRLMCSVCPPLAPAEILPKAPADIEISEEYSIEDDSSCSISGNESPPRALAAGVTATDDPNQTLLKRNVVSSSFNIAGSSKAATNQNLLHSDIPANAKQAAATSAFAHHPNAGVRASAPPAARHANSSSNNNSTSLTSTLPPNNGLPVSAALLVTPTTGAAATAASNLTMIIAGTASSTTSTSSSSTPSTSSSPPTTVMAPPKSAAQAAADSFKALSRNAFLRLKFPTELHVVYLGVLLTMVLALFSVFLLYRILDIEAKTSIYRSPADFNWRNGNDDDIFAEALRWQKELQTKSTEEAQSILTTNLEQIAKVRRSLETLSMLIHDRSSAYANRDDRD